MKEGRSLMWGAGRLALLQSLATEGLGGTRSTGASAVHCRVPFPLGEAHIQSCFHPTLPPSPPLPVWGKDAVKSRATRGSTICGQFGSWSVQTGDRNKGQSQKDKVGLAEGESLSVDRGLRFQKECGVQGSNQQRQGLSD